MTTERLIQRIERLTWSRILLWLAMAFGLVAIGLRLFRITANDFVFYDEGYYLNFNYRLGTIINGYHPSSFQDLSQALYAFACAALATGKTLWFLLVDSRWFFGGLDAWYVGRVWAAVFGLLTFIPFYFFARRFYDSRAVAWLSVILLSILPSHVFYSRIGLQETLSSFLVLSGFYFYVFPRKCGIRTLIAGAIFGAAFFANYRLIMLPVLVAFAELLLALAERQPPQLRKFLWFILTFFSVIFFVGNINDGLNTRVVFAWILHQTELAGEAFSWLNVFSYPYYVFRLETFLFGLIFFCGNLWVLRVRQWDRILPFALVLGQMLFFSFAGEKGARYLCAVMPFMAMSAAYAVALVWRNTPDVRRRAMILAVMIVLVAGMSLKSFAISRIASDYRAAVEGVLAIDPSAKILSTQPYVESLFVTDKKNVADCPHTFAGLLQIYSQGFRYLIIDPQAYISWSEDEKRFTPKLADYLGFMVQGVKPLKIYKNFSPVMLERFVFEHSEHLGRSIAFLDQATREPLGVILVYDLSQAVPQTLAAIAQSHEGNTDAGRR